VVSAFLERCYSNRESTAFVQFTKRIPTLRHVTYEERLSSLGIKSLEHRRLYFDLICLYKIMHGLSVLSFKNFGISSVSSRQALRNYGFGLHTALRPVSSLHVFSFICCVCRSWNVFPRNVCSLSLSAFKNHVFALDLVKLANTGH